jgi:hypothetical protein
MYSALCQRIETKIDMQKQAHPDGYLDNALRCDIKITLKALERLRLVVPEEPDEDQVKFLLEYVVKKPERVVEDEGDIDWT